MKRALLVAMGGVLSLGAGIAAYAQNSLYVVKVPFTFFVGQRQLPAGTYYVDSKRPFDNSPLTMEFIRSGGEAGVALPAAATLESKEKASTPKLVFRQYGSFYFLSEFWGADGRGKHIALSAQEMELATKQTPKELAIAAR